MSLKKKIVYISGMTCVSCEVIIKDELENITSIKNVDICHKTNKAEIEYLDQINIQNIKKVIEKLGYELSETPFATKKIKPTKKEWLIALVALFILYKGYTWIQKSGLLNSLDTGGDTIGYGAAFIIGVVASISTCLTIIGAVVISFGTKYQSQGSKFERTIKPHLLFHLGRVGTFFILGGILGLIGSVIKISPITMAWFSILIAIILIWLGLNITGLAPSITTMGIHMPKGILKHWNRLQNSNHRYAPAILGGFTFFLPCGFTQSMQLFAMGSGSFMIGGLTLAAFAVGTMPLLLLLGVTSSNIQNKKSTLFKLIIGIIIVLFGWYSLASGLAILGISLPTINSNAKEAELVASNESLMSIEQVQTVYMTVDYTGYTPSTIRIKNNVPVRWIIDGKQISGCTNEIIVPELDLTIPLNPGQNIATFTPTKTGQLSFSCWMGMVRGTFIVE